MAKNEFTVLTHTLLQNLHDNNLEGLRIKSLTEIDDNIASNFETLLKGVALVNNDMSH